MDRSGPDVRRVLVAAVVPDTAQVVLREAISLATALGLDVVAVHVDASRVVTARHLDGTVDSTPVDSDSYEELGPRALDDLRRLVNETAQTDTTVTVLGVPGAPAEEIARLAERLNATLIVVGTRKPGLAHHVAEFFTGSVAVHLAHRQTRPVLVVPTRPGSFVQPAPWDS